MNVPAGPVHPSDGSSAGRICAQHRSLAPRRRVFVATATAAAASAQLRFSPSPPYPRNAVSSGALLAAKTGAAAPFTYALPSLPACDTPAADAAEGITCCADSESILEEECSWAEGAGAQEGERSFRGVPVSSASTASRSDVGGNAAGLSARASKQLLWNCAPHPIYVSQLKHVQTHLHAEEPCILTCK